MDPNVINWHSAILGTADGYGNSAERMVLALEAAGQQVSVEPHFIASSGESLIIHVLQRPYRLGATRIVYMQPQALWRKRDPDQVTIGFTMWEDDTLPPTWDAFLDAPDAIAAPSRFCVEVITRRLRELEIQKPVYHVPLGVAYAGFPYRRRSYDPRADIFTFLWTAVNVGDPRKGAREAIAAFQEAFPNGERVRLIMRARMGRLGHATDPRIEWREGLLTEHQKLELLYEAHAYLYPSFGEGFGLQPLEAIASGLPAIVSDNSALSEYRELFYPVACDPEPSGILGLRGIVETKGTWARPRRSELVVALRVMVQSYSAWQDFAERAAVKIRAGWGYEHSARALLDVFDRVRGVPA